MVEVESLDTPDMNPVTVDPISTTPQSNDGEDQDAAAVVSEANGWRELMGKDLMMKV